MSLGGDGFLLRYRTVICCSYGGSTQHQESFHFCQHFCSCSNCVLEAVKVFVSE